MYLKIWSVNGRDSCCTISGWAPQIGKSSNGKQNLWIWGFQLHTVQCTMVVSIDSQNLLFSFDWHHKLIFWCQIGTLALQIGKGSNGKEKLLISRFHPCQLFQLELTRLKSAVWRVGPRIMIFVPRLKWRTTAFDCKISWL